ncbi:tetratricopeptide repeat protein [Mucilaginibacter sp. AW1-3]
MKTLHKTYLTIIFLLAAINVMAQTSQEKAKALVKEGITLHDAGKYTEAIEKYDQAIKLAPDYDNAYYEKGYTLYSSDKQKEAIPVMEKVIELNPKAGGAYDILGSIYDDDKQTDRAIEYYTRGIKADPNYQRLHFNLGITYYRLGKYPEAEACAIDAIRLDPKHASSMRTYALATYKQQKNDCSLLGWCSFILLELEGDRSKTAYTYIKDILNKGIKKTGGKSVTIEVSDKGLASGSMAMQIAVLAATEGKKGLSATDSLALQLKSVFQVLDETSAKSPDAFYTNYFAHYFGKLAKTDNMPAFARLVTYATYNVDSVAWFKEHKSELTAIDKWVKDTTRGL